MPRPEKTYPFFGELLTRAELEAISGLGWAAIMVRKRNGMSLEQAVVTPRKATGPGGKR